MDFWLYSNYIVQHTVNIFQIYVTDNPLHLYHMCRFHNSSWFKISWFNFDNALFKLSFLLTFLSAGCWSEWLTTLIQCFPLTDKIFPIIMSFYCLQSVIDFVCSYSVFICLSGGSIVTLCSTAQCSLVDHFPPGHNVLRWCQPFSLGGWPYRAWWLADQRWLVRMRMGCCSTLLNSRWGWWTTMDFLGKF